ncbi:MAG: ABC transporter permease subunit [Micromonosporaceae bacterium]|nr:ABC transporter permease subunit [Micromonosporaceae bacterium]
MPLLLGSACAALYLYVSSLQLDSIEQRSIARDELTLRLIEHLQLVAVSTVLVIVIAVPLGVLLTRPGFSRLTPPILVFANGGQAVPSIGVLVLLAMIWSTGFWPAIVALLLYALLPVLRNTMVGLQRVDPSLIDAGLGMGLTRLQVLLRIELPLAVPVMLAGIRIALIINVGVAALATFTNAGGLGAVIDAGISLSRMPVLITGSVLTAVLALTLDWLAGLAERLLRPRGI